MGYNWAIFLMKRTITYVFRMILSILVSWANFFMQNRYIVRSDNMAYSCVQLLLSVLLVGCQKSDYVQFKGNLIEETSREPVAGCKVQFSDDAQMYGYAITDANGYFDFIVAPPTNNKAYKLTMIWHESYPSKEIKLDSPLKNIYSYDQYVVYDKTNPYSLPTYTDGRYKYYIHKTLPNVYTWDQAKAVCNNLTDFGCDDWFLPCLTDVQALACHPDLFEDCGILDAPYWTRDVSYGGWIYYTNFYDANEKGGVTQNGNQKLLVIPFRRVEL